jgi:DNA polymerase III subunit epsilon
MKFAVIDVETTGLNPLSDKIIEIGIIFIEDGSEVSAYSQLIHPGRPFPSSISSLTGITGKMAAESPLFEEVASQVNEMTAGYILVGQNVHFDYSFVKNEMRKSGISFSRKTICTAELSRLFFPNKKSHSLKSLCRNFEITNTQPHRALPDASATALAFLEMKNRFGENFITYLLKRKQLNLTASIERINNKIKDLPNTKGVYYFIGKDEKPIYIGKANRIRNRVQSHFRGEGNSVQLTAVIPNIKDIRFFETGSELLASLQEDHEIRHYWPKFNRAQKVNNKRFGIVTYLDMKNRWRMGIAGSGKLHCFSIYFHQYHLASKYISEMVNKYQLNAELCGTGVVQNSVPVDLHNKNFEFMLREIAARNIVEIYFTAGRNEQERGFILIENGIYQGFGYHIYSLPMLIEVFDQNLIKRFSSVTVENMLTKLRKNGPPNCIMNKSKVNPLPVQELHTTQYADR